MKISKKILIIFISITLTLGLSSCAATLEVLDAFVEEYKEGRAESSRTTGYNTTGYNTTGYNTTGYNTTGYNTTGYSSTSSTNISSGGCMVSCDGVYESCMSAAKYGEGKNHLEKAHRCTQSLHYCKQSC